MNRVQEDAWAGGLICFWNTKPTGFARLKAAMDAVGMGEHCPPPYSVGESLKRAMADYGRLHKKELLDGFERKSKISLEVKRHEKAEEDGYELIAVEHGKERNDYTRIFACQVNGTERPELTMGWSVVSNSHEIDDAYAQNRKTVSASAVGQMLVKMIKHFNGTCVREVGGVYYLPDGATEQWEKLASAVEEKDGTEITYHEIRMNQSTMRSIAGAITKELTEAAGKLLEEVQSGKLGQEALDNRIHLAASLRRKCRQYEGILGDPLEKVRTALQEAEVATATAALLAASDA
jgi:hypothetical protein